VGVANYFIDLAVVHPKQSDLYLLGVECDGATYHSARAARDRDKYRQSVLENLGWEIYRIWSTWGCPYSMDRSHATIRFTLSRSAWRFSKATGVE
jgi:hypothetical protein